MEFIFERSPPLRFLSGHQSATSRLVLSTNHALSINKCVDVRRLGLHKLRMCWARRRVADCLWAVGKRSSSTSEVPQFRVRLSCSNCLNSKNPHCIQTTATHNLRPTAVAHNTQTKLFIEQCSSSLKLTKNRFLTLARYL